MKQPSPKELMLYFDGELDPPHVERVERWLAGSPEARAQLEGLDQLGDFVRAEADARAAAMADVTDRVMARLDSPGSAPASRRVARLAAPWVGALAAAAAVALLLRGPSTTPPPSEQAFGSAVAESPSTRASDVPAPELAARPGQLAAGPTGAEIESVDFGDRNGSIFMVAEEGSVTPVVWLLDDNGPAGGTMGPL